MQGFLDKLRALQRRTVTAVHVLVDKLRALQRRTVTAVHVLVDKLRLLPWLVAAVVLAAVVATINPELIEVGFWKLLIISAAAYVGYWLDRTLFHYARPHAWLETATDAEQDDPLVWHLLACVAMLRRAVVIAAVVLGAALGV